MTGDGSGRVPLHRHSLALEMRFSNLEVAGRSSVAVVEQAEELEERVEMGPLEDLLFYSDGESPVSPALSDVVEHLNETFN